jgi:hypothetical protein
LYRGGIEKVAFEDFRALLTEFIGPRIEFMDECAHGNTLLEQAGCDDTSG